MPFRTGIERLIERPERWLQGARRVGLVSHQAATLAGGANSAQALRAVLGARLTLIMGPEHGFFGFRQPGETVAGEQHPLWDIPILSLYGERRHPPNDLSAKVDAVVVDLQDLGVRCYTYVATLLNVLEAVAEARIPIVVADRPVPLPMVVDGPMTDPGRETFVSPAGLPLVYGMTPGETARWWMERRTGPNVSLSVVPMQDYRRNPRREAGWPEWLPPSPGIRAWENAQCYAATVWSEALPAVDVGRGTPLAFRVFGIKGIRADDKLVERLSSWRLPGVAFHAHRFTGAQDHGVGESIDGVRLSVTDARSFRPVRTATAILSSLAETVGPEHLWGTPGCRPDFFDQLFGTNAVRRALRDGLPLNDTWQTWTRASRLFRSERERALLYRAKPA